MAACFWDGWRNLASFGRAARPQRCRRCRDRSYRHHDLHCEFRRPQDDASPVPGGWTPPECRPVVCEVYHDQATGASLRRIRRRTGEQENQRPRRVHGTQSECAPSPVRVQTHTPLMSQGGFNPGPGVPAASVATPQSVIYPLYPGYIQTPGNAITPGFLTGPLPPSGNASSPGFLTGFLPASPYQASPVCGGNVRTSPQVAQPGLWTPPQAPQLAGWLVHQLTPPAPVAPTWTPQPPPAPSHVPSPIQLTTANPDNSPTQFIYTLPAGNLIWEPHPQPHPQVSPAAFFPPNQLLGTNPVPCAFSWNPDAALQLTGGYPLPGTAPNWIPPPWPPVAPPTTNTCVILAPSLIPNPADGKTPHLIWDVGKNPETARKLTGRHVMLPMTTEFTHEATWPTVNRLIIVCGLHANKISQLWPPIQVERDHPITVWDILISVYEFLQKPLTQEEVQYITQLEEGNYGILYDAFFRRCRDSPSLYEYEIGQGMKRVDVLGDNRVWWGTWVSYNADRTWQLNVGLVPLRRPR